MASTTEPAREEYPTRNFMSSRWLFNRAVCDLIEIQAREGKSAELTAIFDRLHRWRGQRQWPDETYLGEAKLGGSDEVETP